MATKAKPIDTAVAFKMHEDGASPREIAAWFHVHTRRVEQLLGIQSAPQDSTEKSPLFTVEFQIAYTEAQLDAAIAEFTAEEKAMALGHILFVRAGG